MEIFDAGPILVSARENLRSWRESGLATLLEGNPDSSNARPMIITNQSLEFRAVSTMAEITGDDELIVPSGIIKALKLLSGEDAMYLPLDTE